MKHTRSLAALSVAATMSLMFFSCNSGGDKTKEGATVDTVAAEKPMEPMAAKPGNVLFIKHKVASFEKWLPAYESHDSVRLANGLHNFVIGRGMDDPNMVLIILKMDDAAKAKAMTASPELKERMAKGGVVGMPTFNFVNVVYVDTSNIEQTARVMMTHHVKDWDAWKKEFDSHKQARVDAGLIDRGVGYSVDDNHMVTLVFAITDMKKAKEFMNSKDLKDKMEKAGVDGPPTAFFYNMAKKY